MGVSSQPALPPDNETGKLKSEEGGQLWRQPEKKETKWSLMDRRDLREKGMETSRRAKAQGPDVLIKQTSFEPDHGKAALPKPAALWGGLLMLLHREETAVWRKCALRRESAQMSTARIENDESKGTKLGSWANSESWERQGGLCQMISGAFLCRHPRKHSSKRLHSLGLLLWHDGNLFNP